MNRGGNAFGRRALQKSDHLPSPPEHGLKRLFGGLMFGALCLAGLAFVVRGGENTVEGAGHEVSAAATDKAAQPLQAQASEGVKQWVTSERLNRRTCPDTNCGIVGQFFFREGVDVFERRGDWARVTKYYPAACEGGRNVYVDAGSSACSEENGVENGKFAEWVSAEFLSANRPADPAATASAYEKLVSQSDDFARYRAAFASAAHQLIEDGVCEEQDFIEMGGWLKSSNHRNRPIYFTYCGGMTVGNRLYLDASSGSVSRNP